MTAPVGGASGAAASARLAAQTRELQAYVRQGGGDPVPAPTVLAQLSAGPIPVEMVQQVQALLAETRRLCQDALAAPAPALTERAERFRSA